MLEKFRRILRPMSLLTFACVVSGATLLLYNIPFLQYAATNSNADAGGKLLMLASLVVIMLAVNFMMTIWSCSCCEGWGASCWPS